MPEPNSVKIAARTEKKWFVRTSIASGFFLLSLFLLGGIQWWAASSAQTIFSGPQAASAELLASHVSFFLKLAVFAGGFMLISGSVFLGSLIRWLFAIRSRRKLEDALETVT